MLYGVREYWIIDPPAQTIGQYLLQGERYGMDFKRNRGEVARRAIADSVFPVAAIFDDAANMAAIKAILYTPLTADTRTASY